MLTVLIFSLKAAFQRHRCTSRCVCVRMGVCARTRVCVCAGVYMDSQIKLHCLHCSLTARRSWVRIPHGSLLALGAGPECTVLKWAISRAFLCGVCMFSPCSQGVSSTK